MRDLLIAEVDGREPGLGGVVFEQLTLPIDDITSNFVEALKHLPSRIPLDMDRRRADQEVRKLSNPKRWKRARHIPRVTVDPTVSLCSSRPNEAVEGLEQETKFIQFTDLLLGVIWDDVTCHVLPQRVKKTGRLQIVRQFKEAGDNSVVLKWRSRLPVLNKISVSIYPDEFNLAYSAVSFADRPGQQEFKFDAELFESRSRRRERIPSVPGAVGAWGLGGPESYPLKGESPDEREPAGIGVTESRPMARRSAR